MHPVSTCSLRQLLLQLGADMGLFTDIMGAVDDAGNAVETGAEDLGSSAEAAGKELGSSAEAAGKQLGAGAESAGKYLWTQIKSPSTIVGKVSSAITTSKTPTTTATGRADKIKTLKKATTKKPTKTAEAENQKYYQQALSALLQPFATAIGDLPAQYKSLVTSIENTSDYTPTEVDATAKSIASQYSPTVVAKTGSSAENSALSSITSAIKQMMSPTGEFAKALGNLKTDQAAYMKELPYKQLTTGLLNRIRFTIMYHTGVGPAAAALKTSSSGMPKYLQTIYKEAITGSTSPSTEKVTKAKAAKAAHVKDTKSGTGTTTSGSVPTSG